MANQAHKTNLSTEQATRRNFLQLSGGVAVAAIPYTAVALQKHDLLIEIGRKHAQALDQWLIAVEKYDDWENVPECEHWYEQRWKCVETLQNTQATSLQGIAAQLNMVIGEFGSGDGFPIEMEACLVKSIKSAVEKLAA